LASGLTVTKYLIFKCSIERSIEHQLILSSSCHYFTHTSPTKMGYNITFLKISRRKEGGGGQGKIETPKKYFSKKILWEFLRGPKKSDQISSWSRVIILFGCSDGIGRVTT